jgi:hypothetical protein
MAKRGPVCVSPQGKSNRSLQLRLSGSRHFRSDRFWNGQLSGQNVRIGG